MDDIIQIKEKTTYDLDDETDYDDIEEIDTNISFSKSYVRDIYTKCNIKGQLIMVVKIYHYQ